ncbi:TIGR02679 family protein [Streptomyces sp. NBC_01433]|uniref:TIGR02679 family protein n=1 Tax=Streptomyces sp. NBC_01433 TaxID=2903864 RepID=UPI00224D30C3|nr:TIGR02679 family protein [Streptomyces sp. NBC_01433]MCX4680152.1 TIGR02679 family protein [Streptomyces sp. NBC_01433]
MKHPLDRPELATLWRAFHARLSTGAPVTRVRVGPLDEAARGALADLLGLDRLPGPQPTVALARLDEALLDSCGHNTRSVVADIVGPLGDRAADRASGLAARAALWEWLATHPVVLAQPALTAWADAARRAGLIGGGVPATREVLRDALTVLAELPAHGEPLPVFATRVLNDSHALDDGTRLSGLVLRALCTLYGTPVPGTDATGTDTPGTAEPGTFAPGPAAPGTPATASAAHGTPALGTAADRRALWSRAGIADDALSTTVLTAGLRPSGHGPVARALAGFSAAGHAAHLTLAQLRSPGDLRLPPATVHITENPSILALALRRFGPACPPLICTSGWPNSAAVFLLHRLAGAGAALRYHGDLDGEGLRIAAHVLARSSAVPWRMSASDYVTAHAVAPSGPAAGRITEAPWDPDLAPALRERGTAVLEEHVAETLLADLAEVAGPH